MRTIIKNLDFTPQLRRTEYSRINEENSFEIIGNKGCRGLMPENTIPAFIEAIKSGATQIQLDIVVSGDGKLVVSSRHCFDPSLTLTLDGNLINSKVSHNIYEMTYEEVKKYDCGTRINPLFPYQKSLQATKPLLAEVINRTEKFTVWNNKKPVYYNIEIKSGPDGDNLYHPIPEEFVLKLYDLLKMKNVFRRCIIQSFDVRPLRLFKRINNDTRISLLVKNNNTLEENINTLGFKPDIYSPWFALVDRALIKEVHYNEMRIIPWTVNEILDINALKQMGADGIITDYPDIALKTIN